MKKNEKWLDWAIEIQAFAQAGLHYAKDKFDVARYQRLREIAIEMIEYKTDISKEKVADIFGCEEGYQTPKIGIRASIFKGNKILMIQECNGMWTLPGGWADVDLSVADNIVKEVKEEAGLDVDVDFLISVGYQQKQKEKEYRAIKVVEIFAKCVSRGGEFKGNIETIDSEYFSWEEILENKDKIWIQKTSLEQIKMCFDANKSKNWKTYVD